MWRPHWYSSVTPFAPRMSRASRAMSRAIETQLRLASEIWPGVSFSASLSRPSRQHSSCALVISETISTSFCWTSW